MKKKQRVKEGSDKDNFYNRVVNYCKNNKLLTTSYLIVVIFTLFNQSGIFDFINKLTTNSKKKESLVGPTELDSSKCFLVFPNKKSFDVWNKEVGFKLGLPKYPRNATTQEVDNQTKINQYAIFVKHPDSSDPRIRCGFGNNIPKDLIDENASKKFNFIRASYSDIEEMGFIKDNPAITGEEIFDFVAPELLEYVQYTRPVTSRRITSIPEFNFMIVMIMYKRNESRNKYYIDVGITDNKNRISVYHDKKDILCFRIIDENGFARILRVRPSLYNKKYQFNFRFGANPKQSYMEIFLNGQLVAFHETNKMIPLHYMTGSKVNTGANIDGTYCGSMKIITQDYYVIDTDKKKSILHFDYQQLDRMYFSDGEIIYYKDDGQKIYFYRN